MAEAAVGKNDNLDFSSKVNSHSKKKKVVLNYDD
jgi:hypothetical protein